MSLLRNKLSFNSNKYLLDSLQRNLKSSCITLWSQASIWSLLEVDKVSLTGLPVLGKHLDVLKLLLWNIYRSYQYRRLCGWYQIRLWPRLFRLRYIKYDALRATSWHFLIILLASKSFDLRNCSNEFVDPVNLKEEILRRIKLKCVHRLWRALPRFFYLAFL